MLNNKKEDIRDIELFMLAQFIDVIDIISKYKNISEVREDINQRKKIYLERINKYNSNISFKSLDLNDDYINKKINMSKNIYPSNMEYNEIHLAYKIGLIEGLKIKNNCTN